MKNEIEQAESLAKKQDGYVFLFQVLNNSDTNISKAQEKEIREQAELKASVNNPQSKFYSIKISALKDILSKSANTVKKATKTAKKPKAAKKPKTVKKTVKTAKKPKEEKKEETDNTDTKGE